MVGSSSGTVGWMCIARCMHGKGSLGVHEIDDAVDDLVACKSKERGTENLFAVSIRQDFREALGLALLKRATDVFHQHCRNQRGLAGLAYLCFRHAYTTERGIRVERISGDSIGHAPPIIVQDVGCYDLEVIV